MLGLFFPTFVLRHLSYIAESMSPLLQLYYSTQFQKASSKIFARDCIDTVVYHVHRDVTIDHGRVSSHPITDIRDLRIEFEQTRAEPLDNVIM